MEPQPFIDIHTHQKDHTTNDESIAVVNIFAQDFEKSLLKKNEYYSVGLHPWHIDKNRLAADLKNLESALSEKSVAALGEAGLDRLAKAPLKIQEEVFQFHLQKAHEFRKPLIVHAVKSYPDIIAAYKKSGVNPKLIIHGFTGNQQSTHQLIQHGFFLSFGSALLDEQKKAADVFRLLPDDRFFLESDDSAITISKIYQTAAKIKNISVEELKKMIYQNFKNCFGDIYYE